MKKGTLDETAVLERWRAPSRFAKLPAEMRDVFLKQLGLLLKAMPRAERARIVVPPSHPVGALVK